MTRVVTLIVALVLAHAQVPRSAAAQGTRAERIRAGLAAADTAFQPQYALQLLTAGVDPALGPVDSLWAVGVRTLVEVLIGQRQDSLAAYWARWAMRLAPGFVIDTVSFAPRVAQAFRSAQAHVSAVRERAETTWRWAVAQDLRTPGSVRAVQRPGTAPVDLVVTGRGTVQPGDSLSLPAGSYVFLARAPGFLPVEVTREILPGVETILSFRLLPENAGFLYVSSQPWGRVIIDDEPIGFTTLVAHRLAVGTHRVRVQRDHYMPIDTVVEISRDERKRLAVRLTPRQP